MMIVLIVLLLIGIINASIDLGHDKIIDIYGKKVKLRGEKIIAHPKFH